MRKIALKEVEINGEKLPYYCDLFVLSKIQEKMSVAQFERDILGAKPRTDEEGNIIRDEDGRIQLIFDHYVIETMIFGLTLMINEGITVMKDQEECSLGEVNEAYIGRCCTMQPAELSDLLSEEFNRCFAVKKNQTTENQKTKTQ
ncbi:MAG: hypothetical protein E7306_03605 [Butyrivibrio sp.]|nr:hypothetical protein [Butyrivibrio sp.]